VAGNGGLDGEDGLDLAGERVSKSEYHGTDRGSTCGRVVRPGGPVGTTGCPTQYTPLAAIIGHVSRREVPAEEFRYRLPIAVRFRDTDALGHVNNAVYLTYFEAVRAGYYEAVAGRPFGFGEGAERHTFLIAEASIICRSQSFFGETLDAACRVAWVSRSSFGVDYRIDAPASEVAPARLVAHGTTLQVMFDVKASRVGRIPSDLLEMIERHEGHPLPPRPAGW
jgi:acyl-CoA thioester hydrolase